MARLQSSIPPPTQSVLDRLIDDEPDDQAPEKQVDYHSGLARLRDAVLRDVRWLLNARIGSLPSYLTGDDDEGDPLIDTVARLGLPDITTTDLKNHRQSEQLRRRIVDTITRFEPRLDFVTVSGQEEGEGRGRTRFHIEARLRVDPEPLKLSFDATVVWRNRTVEVG